MAYDEQGHFRFIPSDVVMGIWNYARPYKHLRLWLRDAPFIPGWARPFLRGSASIGGIVAWAIGSDPIPEEGTDGQV